MLLLNRLLFIASIGSLVSCGQKNNNTEANKEPDDVTDEIEIYAHTRWASQPDVDTNQSTTIKTFVGDDIGLKIPVTASINYGAMNIPIGFYTDSSLSTKVKASKLTNYDGSFKDIYIVCEEPAKIDISFFNGVYLNEQNDSLSISNGCFEISFGENTINGKFGWNKIEYSFYDCAINGIKIDEQFEDYNKDEYKKRETSFPSNYSSKRASLNMGIQKRSFTPAIMFEYLKLVELKDDLSFYKYTTFVQDNNVTVDYDLSKNKIQS